MSLVTFAYTLSGFWLIIHLLHRLSKHNGRQETILPSFGTRARSSLSEWHITIQFLQARIETSRWNKIHDKLLTRLKKKERGRGNGAEWSRMWLERFYNVGFWVGVVGMAVTFVLLVWTTWTLVKPFEIHKITEASSKAVGRLMKRDGQSHSQSAARMAFYEEMPESPITPILPGVTVPLSHITFIIITLFLSQIVHEVGHAVSGALYGVPILSSGASLVVCIPTAFVAFSTATLDTLRPSAKSRIVAAGPFHNLLFWCFWMLVGYVGGVASGILMPIMGYRDVSGVGRAVIGVDEASPLAGYLIPGTIITKLNDRSMSSSNSDSDPWSSFLKSSRNDELNLGWCVDSKEMGVSSKECCLPDELSLTSLSCFVANTTPIQLGCLNPVPVLTSLDDGTRCASENGCKDGFVCVRPADQERLLRLTVRENKEGREKIVLWTGPRGEIFDEVTVGKWHPKFSILPLNLPIWLKFFWEYMLTVNLSLFLFNLVPISGLDGAHLLRSMFTTIEQRSRGETYDLEALERGDVGDIPSSRNAPKMKLLERAISGGAGILVGLDLFLVVLALFRT